MKYIHLFLILLIVYILYIYLAVWEFLILKKLISSSIFILKYPDILYNLVSLKNRFRLINAVKPHTMKVSLLVMDPLKNLIITGSEDKSLFFFKFLTSDKGIDMDPIRCVTLDFVAINFEWLSSKVIEIYYTYI